MGIKPFPTLSKAPSSRSFDPGSYPEEVFEAQNGAKTILRYGNKRTDARLDISFKGLSDSETVSILQNYTQVNSTDTEYLTFSNSNGLAGIDNSTLLGYMDGNSSNMDGMKWRYKEPPKVTTTYKNFHNVRCSFVGCQYGS